MNTGQGENRIAENALNFAKSEVDTATAQVDDVRRHFSDAIEKSREPETYVARYVALLKKATGDGFHRRRAIRPQGPPPVTWCR